MNHQILWAAISKLAKEQGLTCSGLARLGGLDATTFNKSKQFSPDGSPRWPSRSTIDKVINTNNKNALPCNFFAGQRN